MIVEVSNVYDSSISVHHMLSRLLWKAVDHVGIFDTALLFAWFTLLSVLTLFCLTVFREQCWFME